MRISIRRLLLVWLGGAGTALLCAGSDAVLARQPEPVVKRSCDLPTELKGMTGHVLVRYTVNEAGNVNFVKPAFATADPEARREELVASVTSCVKEWSYPPMKPSVRRSFIRPPADSVSGNPIFSVEFLQGFHYFEPADAGVEWIELEGGRKVPRAHIEKMRALKIDLAMQLLGGPDRHETKGTGWSLRTNVTPKERKALVGGVEFALEAFDRVFGDAPPLPESSRLVLLLLGSEDAFNQVAAFDRIFRGPKPAGEYTPADETAYAFASDREHPLKMSVETTVHETVHHLVQQRLAGVTRPVPYWVNEGIASYFELLKPDKTGAFDPQKFKRGRQSEGSYYWPAKADMYLEAFERNMRSGTIPDFAAFLEGRFEGIGVDTSYGLSWILTHYMLFGENGTLKKPFLDWATGPMGSDADEGVAKSLGRTPEQILAGVTAYVGAMKRS